MGDKAKDIADCPRLLLNDAAIGQPPKGKGEGVPQLGDADGPILVENGWRKGYKLLVGDLPTTIDKVEIGKLRSGYIDVAMNNTRSKYVHAFAMISLDDMPLAVEAFEKMQRTKFDPGDGQLHWPSVKWFGHGKHH